MAIRAPIDVVVVGGSLTGLAAGVALKTLPFVKSVTILERYQHSKLEDQGAGIRVGPEVQDFYQKYAGVSPEAYSLAIEKYKILAGDGSVIVERSIPGSFASSWGQLFRVLKETFMQDSTPCTCRYRNGCRVTNILEKGSQVDVNFHNESNEERTASADLVLGADGASSIVRQLFSPGTQRTYAGYVILRGLVPLERLSDKTRADFDGTGIMCFNHNSQALSYNVPGSGASVEEAEILCNWGWYSVRTEDELADLMIDKNGVKHSFSLPIGGMQAKWAERIRNNAQTEVPPQLAEAIQKTEKPFVQVITDSLVTENVFCNGKVLLVGDAAAGQRPHTASAVTQCVFAATLLTQYLQGQINIEGWSRETHLISSTLVRAGQQLGPIAMSTSLDPQEKMRQFLQQFFGTQGKLLAKWRENGLSRETNVGVMN